MHRHRRFHQLLVERWDLVSVESRFSRRVKLQFVDVAPLITNYVPVLGVIAIGLDQGNHVGAQLSQKHVHGVFYELRRAV